MGDPREAICYLDGRLADLGRKLAAARRDGDSTQAIILGADVDATLAERHALMAERDSAVSATPVV